MADWQKVRNSWEMRSLFFLARAGAVLLCITYILFTIQPALSWVEMKRIRAAPLSQIEKVADAALAADRPRQLKDWMNYRPASERAEIIRLLDSRAPKLESLTFLTYSRWMWRAGDREAALFWQQYALFRLRYDSLRCGRPKEMAKLIANFDLLPVPDMAQSLRAVLDYDKAHPADNNPRSMCILLYNLSGAEDLLSIVPREAWKPLYETLRSVTEYRLKEMESGKTPAAD